MATARALRSREISRDLEISNILECETQFSRSENIMGLAPRVQAVQKRIRAASKKETSWMDEGANETFEALRAEMKAAPPIDVDFMKVSGNVERELTALERIYP